MCALSSMTNAAPEHYDERYESWRFEDLPILPVEWKLLVHNTKKPQFNVLRKLLRSKKFDYVVNAYVRFINRSEFSKSRRFIISKGQNLMHSR